MTNSVFVWVFYYKIMTFDSTRQNNTHKIRVVGNYTRFMSMQFAEIFYHFDLAVFLALVENFMTEHKQQMSFCDGVYFISMY